VRKGVEGLVGLLGGQQRRSERELAAGGVCAGSGSHRMAVGPQEESSAERCQRQDNSRTEGAPLRAVSSLYSAPHRRRFPPAATVLIAAACLLALPQEGMGQATVTRRDCALASGETAPASFSDIACPLGGTAASLRLFKVTLGGPADEVTTSIISPDNAVCSGTGAGYLCSAPASNVVAYSVFTAQGCTPDSNNNNFADETARFSKSVVVCRPCVAGDYYISLRPIRSDMSCNFKLFLPKVTGDGACTVDPAPSVPPACADGLVRGSTCDVGVQADGYSCLFGSCNMWGWYGLALGLGLFPCIISIPLFLMIRAGYLRQIKDAGAAQIGFQHNLDKNQGNYGGDSDDDAAVPDELPPTFFVNDAET